GLPGKDPGTAGIRVARTAGGAGTSPVLKAERRHPMSGTATRPSAATSGAHPPSLSIIGAGNLGKTLAHLWHRQKIFSIRDVYSRDPQRARDAAGFIGAGQAQSVLTDLRMADAYLLSVPDDSIAAVCRQLAAAGLVRPGCLVFHCSGALTAALLQAARGCGAEVASVHPIRSFADPATLVDDFAGTWC